jgi:hypothetical protein
VFQSAFQSELNFVQGFFPGVTDARDAWKIIGPRDESCIGIAEKDVNFVVSGVGHVVS